MLNEMLSCYLDKDKRNLRISKTNAYIFWKQLLFFLYAIKELIMVSYFICTTTINLNILLDVVII